MKKMTLLTYAMMLALGLTSSAWAKPQTMNTDLSTLSPTERQMTQALQAAFPKNRIRWVKSTPIAGLWEVTMGTNIAYVAADADRVFKTALTETNKTELFRHWVFGATVFDMKTARDITTPAKELAQQIDISTLPVKNAITRVRGKGERVLYVFTDPDCPHCRRLEMTLESLDNVTIHTFLTPVVALHPKAREVATSIWCAKEPVKALLDYMTDSQTSLPSLTCRAPIEENERLMQTLGIKGTPTLFFADGSRHTGAMNATELENTLKQKPLKGATR